MKITHADGSYGAISYTTNCATATDEQGKARKVCTDGLGRVTSVIEDPGTSPHLNYTTTYAYDALDNVASVVQGSETRSFAYDGLSRLASATNPESGTISYTYDAYSNVATRTDARSIITTYSYDAAERLTSKTYSDGTPGAYFYYDQSSWNGITLSNGIGRLTSQGVYNGSQWLASSAFSYDGLGHVTNNPQYTLTINSILQVPYTYDLVGDMLTYGNGASWLTFSQSFNIGGRVTGLTSSWVDSQHPGTLVSGVHYNGAGGVTSYVLGNNLTETAAYNGLVQPCRMNVNSSGALLGSCTASVPSGNVLDLTTGFNYGSGDNGNVMSWAAAGQQTFNRSYTYDGVNRLASMSAPGSTCTGLTWSYDQWANRTDQSYTGGTCNTFHQPVNGNNHFINSPYQYDAAGNMTHDATHSYAYDAENRITKVDGGSTATYGYDVDGRRVSRVVAGVETDYIYDLAGHVVADYGGGCGPTCWRVGYVYLNGEAVAEYFGGTNFYVTDHLGSTRLLTGYPTASVVECDDYYPFGEQVSCGGTSTTTHKFTGYERDSESNLDNAQARYNSSSLGRFMSPDPLGNFVADSTNPQTWNMYAYVNNNPLTYVDPSGTICTQDSQGNFVGDTCGQDTGTGNAPETVNVTTNDSNGNQNTQAWSSADPTFLNFGDGDITALRQSRPDAGWINLQMRRLQAMAGFFRAPSNEAMKFATRNVPGGGQPFKTTPPPSQIPGEEPPPSIEDIIGERGMQMKELMDKIGEWSAGTMEGIGDGLGDFMLQITHAQPCLNPNGCIPSS